MYVQFLGKECNRSTFLTTKAAALSAMGAMVTQWLACFLVGP